MTGHGVLGVWGSGADRWTNAARPRRTPDADPPLALVTGGSGLLGSHIASNWRGGDRVRAFLRANSDDRFLRSLGVEVVRGDLARPEDCDRALSGVSAVFHAAAKVGDWGRWAEFQVGCLDATTNLADAAIRSGVRRFVHHQLHQRLRPPRRGRPADRRGCAVGPAPLAGLGPLHAEQGRVRTPPVGPLLPPPPHGDPPQLAVRRARPHDRPSPGHPPPRRRRPPDRTRRQPAFRHRRLRGRPRLPARLRRPPLPPARRTTSPTRGSSPSATTSTSGSPPSVPRRSATAAATPSCSPPPSPSRPWGSCRGAASLRSSRDTRRG